MAIAGRVAMIPKGNYDATVTYQILDVVRYNDASYVAKKSSTGILPTNTEYWMVLTQDGLTVDDELSDTSERPVQNKVVNESIQNILNGTTPVGDTLKLGGKGASEYALLTALAFGVSGSKSLGSVTSLDELDNYYGVNGYVNVEISGDYQKVIVISGVNNTIQISLSVYSKILKFRWNYYSGDGKMLWSDWSTPATTADLANYLPKSGGTVTGEVTIKPTTNSNTPLMLDGNSTGYQWSLSGYKIRGELAGYLGFDATNKPTYHPGTRPAISYDLLHTGNKPSGSYTGTGAARTIPTGGIGNVCWIGVGWISLLVTATCAIVFHVSDTGSELLKVLAPNQIKFENGVLTISNDSSYYPYFNASGAVYNYQVL